ncbi:uncharacterized protein LOC129720040 [Wyeomyia smithii]|uniref:uncharacterized protein LOC129720040 n=1 Tax=Wyeomyia smithii TaxID=174621 RepID=UPI002467CB1F|nr:uncharacterized protein LOC129720040 [Wyeomyia smithii]
MNRILTKHFFEKQIFQDKRYPSWQQKKDLAIKIIEEFSQLEKTRINPDSPEESFFFWRQSGKEHGCHSGIIETRVENMRKDILPENRLFRRVRPKKIIVPETSNETAALLAALSATAQNAKYISDSMAECTEIHQWILNKKSENNTQEILEVFPHLLNYNGLLVLHIQQAYERIHTSYNTTADLKSFLSLAVLLDENCWLSVEDSNLKGLLIFKKKLGNRGVKRVADTNEQLSMEELLAWPLIRWMKSNGDPENVQVDIYKSNKTDPHILCIGEKQSRGNMYLIFYSYSISCGNSSLQAIEVFFKSFSVLGIPIPLQLKKIHDFLSIKLWKTLSSTISVTVQRLISKIIDYEQSLED